jgi:glycosyltransferase involved in cell wall biosynthesis
VLGVLVTYRRPRALATMLARLAAQEAPPEALLVVDNAGMPETGAVLRRHAPGLPARLLSPGENLGPAGGFALGMRQAVEVAGPDDWILLLDDDDPPPERRTRFLADLRAVAAQVAEQDPVTGAVGAGGAWFDARRGRMRRVADRELADLVRVDCIANSLFPLYRVRAVREAGVQDGRLFFGFGELEYGLRLQAAGFHLYLAGAPCRQRRGGRPPRAGARVQPPWRRYYGVRNMVHLLRTSGHSLAAARVTVLQGLARPLLSAPGAGQSRLAAVRAALSGARDGWRGRLGRTVEPVVADRPVEP